MICIFEPLFSTYSKVPIIRTVTYASSAVHTPDCQTAKRLVRIIGVLEYVVKSFENIALHDGTVYNSFNQFFLGIIVFSPFLSILQV